MSNFERYTNIYITGENTFDLLRRNNISEKDFPEVNEQEEMLLVSFAGGETVAPTVLGDIAVSYSCVSQGEDLYGKQIFSHEVSLQVESVRALQGQKSQNKNRRIHVHKFSGIGKQKVRKGVALVVKTNVSRTVFEQSVRM